MLSIFKKGLPLAATLLLLAGSPAFAANQNLHKNGRVIGLSTSTYALRNGRVIDLSTSTYTRGLPPSSLRSDDSDPYGTLWLQGYPRSSAAAPRVPTVRPNSAIRDPFASMLID